MPKAVVDHNVFITGLLSSHGVSAELIDRLRDGQFRIIYTTELVTELRQVLSRPRMRKKYGVTAAEISGLLRVTRARGRQVSITGKRRWCRDPDDDLLCEAAVAGRAHYLVTSDQDLLSDESLVQRLRLRGVRVIRPYEFLDILRSGVPARVRHGKPGARLRMN